MVDRLLVLVPHEHTHAPRSVLEQARKLGPDVTEMRAITHTMEIIAHSLCIANGAPAEVAWEGWPGKTALLNGQSMGTKSELHQSQRRLYSIFQMSSVPACVNGRRVSQIPSAHGSVQVIYLGEEDLLVGPLKALPATVASCRQCSLHSYNCRKA